MRAAESDLRAANLVEDAHSTALAPAENASAETELFKGRSGTTTLIKNHEQSLVSQTVSWEAKVVDKISDVMDSMNISGMCGFAQQTRPLLILDQAPWLSKSML